VIFRPSLERSKTTRGGGFWRPGVDRAGPGADLERLAGEAKGGGAGEDQRDNNQRIRAGFLAYRYPGVKSLPRW